MPNKAQKRADAVELRSRAERRLLEQEQNQRAGSDNQRSEGDSRRLLHELQVHQIQLEMQNAELSDARTRMGLLLEKFTDLYDFAPVGYFSLDEQGRILEVNLTSSAMLGMERAQLVGRRLVNFVTPSQHAEYNNFLKKIFTECKKQVCELALKDAKGAVFWVDLQAIIVALPAGSERICRLAVSDITALKRAAEEQRRLEALELTNRALEEEILRRKAVEKALRKSEGEQRQMLEDSRWLQQQLRKLSYQILQAQEDERKRISRELHDEIAQTLVGINVHLGSLANEVTLKVPGFRKMIDDTQKLVERSVNSVHRFAMELRPSLLDDLGLVPALQSYIRAFTRRTKIEVSFRAFSDMEQLSSVRCTVLYRVAQSALSNVAQHAQATEVQVSIEKVRKKIRMEVHDNGKSFNVEQALDVKKNKRLGLIGMRERAEMVGGNFSITSEPGMGTTVAVEFPYISATKKKRAGAPKDL